MTKDEAIQQIIESTRWLRSNMVATYKQGLERGWAARDTVTCVLIWNTYDEMWQSKCGVLQEPVNGQDEQPDYCARCGGKTVIQEAE